MKKKTVAVLFGGRSPEYDVSLKSAYSIINAIDRDKYDVTLIGITRQGKWYEYNGDAEGLINDRWHLNLELLQPAIISPSRGGGLLVFDDFDLYLKGNGHIYLGANGMLERENRRQQLIEGGSPLIVGKKPPGDSENTMSAYEREMNGFWHSVVRHGSAMHKHIDAAFPVLHGRYGEDGTVQGVCELAGIPVVGSGSAASALCMDKDRAHKLVSQAGIRVPKAVCFEQMPSAAEISAAAADLGFPLFVKPVKAGSSFGITMVEDESELAGAVALALEFDDAVIIEESIDGFETGCAVVGNMELMTGRIDEIELAHGFFDYEEKYTLKTSKIHMPARIDEAAERMLQETAKEIYRILGCRGYARVDIFYSAKNEIIFNEANTIPGFTSHSRFPNMMKGVGIEYPELVDMLIELGIANAASIDPE
ncbi:MAG: D-alanine--D-alanine ligase [Oscillospiraceae bacterium]|nr:D-alanine--D-alanine ligase [Oscillospiraceae bacterium]